MSPSLPEVIGGAGLWKISMTSEPRLLRKPSERSRRSSAVSCGKDLRRRAMMQPIVFGDRLKVSASFLGVAPAMYSDQIVLLRWARWPASWSIGLFTMPYWHHDRP